MRELFCKVLSVGDAPGEVETLDVLQRAHSLLQVAILSRSEDGVLNAASVLPSPPLTKPSCTHVDHDPMNAVIQIGLQDSLLNLSLIRRPLFSLRASTNLPQLVVDPDSLARLGGPLGVRPTRGTRVRKEAEELGSRRGGRGVGGDGGAKRAGDGFSGDGPAGERVFRGWRGCWHLEKLGWMGVENNKVERK